MSHTKRNTFGLEHGKIGDRIAVVLNGKQVYKSLYKPTNPRSPKQQMHRAKLAFINRLSAVLADAVNLSFSMVPKPDSGQSPRNAFVKMNWDNGSLVWDEDKGEWTLNPNRLVLADGPRFISDSMTAAIRNSKLYITCPNPGLENSHAVNDDKLFVAIYRPKVQELHFYAGPLRVKCGKSVYELPELTGKDDIMLVYAWFQATLYHRSNGNKITVRPGQASKSLYLGSFSL